MYAHEISTLVGLSSNEARYGHVDTRGKYMYLISRKAANTSHPSTPVRL